MKKLFAFLFSFCVLTSALAQNRITATVTVTNSTVNGNTFSVNSGVRTFTNQVFQSGTQVLATNDVTGCSSKTNLFTQIALNPFPAMALYDTGSNTFQLQGTCGGAMTISIGGTWASVSYSTQTCATATPVGVPFASYYASLASRSNVASQLEADLLNYTTNSQLVDLAKTQTVTGKKTFNNTNNFIAGIISSLAISGNSVLLTNGIYFTPFLSSPIMTNGVNYGNAFSSPSVGSSSEAFGSGSIANGVGGVAVGKSSTENGDDAIAIGFASSAAGDSSVAFGDHASSSAVFSLAEGANASASVDNSTALGEAATASGTNSTALGTGATSLYFNSTAIGAFSSNTAPNQVMLGGVGSSVVVQNNLSVQTNETVGGSIFVSGGENVFGLRTNAAFTGTNNFPAGADIAFTRFPVTSLANGNNAGVPIGTNEFIEVSGPSGSFTINGIANGRDGKIISILNQSGFQMTIANESGTDPTAANRIRTLGSATDLVLTNAMVNLQYSGAASRWIVKSHNP